MSTTMQHHSHSSSRSGSWVEDTTGNTDESTTMSAWTGWCRGETITYIHRGVIDPPTGVEPAAMWVIDGGVDDQTPIMDVRPGDPGYRPERTVVLAQWLRAPRLLTGVSDLLAAWRNGDLELTHTDIVVDCPVIS